MEVTNSEHAYPSPAERNLGSVNPVLDGQEAVVTVVKGTHHEAGPSEGGLGAVTDSLVTVPWERCLKYLCFSFLCRKIRDMIVPSLRMLVEQLISVKTLDEKLAH